MAYFMPFGKFKGLPLNELEDSYLAWLQTIELREPLSSAVDEEVARRSAQTQPMPSMAVEIIKAGYRALAQKHHPDRGGSTQVMQELNDAKAWLNIALEESQ